MYKERANRNIHVGKAIMSRISASVDFGEKGHEKPQAESACTNKPDYFTSCRSKFCLSQTFRLRLQGSLTLCLPKPCSRNHLTPHNSTNRESLIQCAIKILSVETQKHMYKFTFMIRSFIVQGLFSCAILLVSCKN